MPLVTVLWLLGMAKAINLIDGLDGLAAGIVAIAAGAFFLYSQRLDDAGLLDGAEHRPADRDHRRRACASGFLPHNFNPARIFMGDGGALLLGLLMAASTSVVGGRADPNQGFSGQTYFFLAPLVHPAVHPRRADPRHAVRDHPPGRRRARRRPWPTRATSTTG